MAAKQSRALRELSDHCTAGKDDIVAQNVRKRTRERARGDSNDRETHATKRPPTDYARGGCSRAAAIRPKCERAAIDLSDDIIMDHEPRPPAESPRR